MGYIVNKGKSKKGNSQYLARYQGSDGKTHSQTFSRKVDAQNFLDTTKTNVRRREWTDPKAGKTIFDDVVSQWQRGRRGLRPTTIATQDNSVKVHLLPHFAGIEIGQIDWEDVEDFRDALLLDRGLAPATVSKSLTYLGQIFKLAQKKRFVLANPCDLVDGPGHASTKEMMFLEADQLIDLAEAIDPRFRAMVLLAGFRGLRFGEVLGLKIGRLNLLKERLEVKEILTEVAGRQSYGPPKTKAGKRTVALPPFLCEALEEHMSAFRPSEAVFTMSDGSLIRRSNFARRIWKPATLKAGIGGFTFHGMRHSAVSMLIAETGAQMVEIGAIMGWSKNSIPAMAARYGHLYPSRDEELTDAIEQVFRKSAHQTRTKTVLDLPTSRAI